MTDPVRRISAIALLVGLCALVASCVETGTYVMERQGDDAIIVTVPRCTAEATNHLMVRRVGDGESVPIWSIDRVGPESPDLETFTLGVVPPGFEEQTPYRADLVVPDAKIYLEVDPPTGSLGVVQLSEVPADGQPYEISTNHDPKGVDSLKNYVARFPSDCRSATSDTQRTATVIVLALGGALVAGGLCVVILRIFRRRPMDSSRPQA